MKPQRTLSNLSRDVPLQPLRTWQVGVWGPTAVTFLSITQDFGVHGQHMLQDYRFMLLCLPSWLEAFVWRCFEQVYLPQVTDDGSVRPGMLCVQSHGAVFENNQVKGFIKPPVKENVAFQLVHGWTEAQQAHVVCLPVVALPMEQRLGVTVQRHDGVFGVIALLRVVQGYEEGRLLNSIQRLLVLAAAEVRVASIGPWGPVGQIKSANSVFPHPHYAGSVVPPTCRLQ